MRLRCGGAVLELLPEIGGAVGRFSIDGVDVLRPAPLSTDSPLATACFPLVPFANRIAHGVFHFDGRAVRLPRNFGEHPHALHGHGWQNPWQVVSHTPDRADLAYEHIADAWPWPYRVEQRIALSSLGARLELTLANCGTQVMPASVGFHPFFVRGPGTTLTANVAGVWLSDETCIPTSQSPAATFLDLAPGASLADAGFVDHCHFGWSRRASIFQPERRGFVELTASPELHHLHIFNPLDAPVFCVEPMSAMPNALNRGPADVRVIAPGASMSVWMELAVRT
jgi:aldose 1-epimerase